MNGKDFLSIFDLQPIDVSDLVHKAGHIKSRPTPRLLKGKVIALLFEKPSLRTRVSFEVGISQMGGQCVYLGKDDVGLGIREPEADVARVLDRWVDGIVARVFSHHRLDLLAQHTSIPIVNALSDLEHPCQAIGDLLTIYEHKGHLEGLKVTFVGDGNNVASSLALACASTGTDFTLSSPKGYEIPVLAWKEALRRAALKGSKMEWSERPSEAVRGADVVYTDVWVSMGHEGEESQRLEAFAGYQVNEKLMDLAESDSVFMHDMPAHRGYEISAGMIDHPRSVIFDQSENRLYAQKAILAGLFERA